MTRWLEKPLANPPTRHAPKAHAKHGNSECGCVVDDKLPAILCAYCGAAYDESEVMEFPIWQCYDCGRGVATGPVIGEAK